MMWNLTRMLKYNVMLVFSMLQDVANFDKNHQADKLTGLISSTHASTDREIFTKRQEIFIDDLFR